MPTLATTSTSCPKWSRRWQSGEYGLAIGSRYVKGGGIENWPARRIITSQVACMLARPLTPVNDITSGYFLVRREALEGVTLDPIGFKIGLEVIAKAHYGRAIEIPYVFTDRVVGESKLNQKEIFNYLKQLRQTVFGAPVSGKRRLMAIPDWLRSRRGKDADGRDAALWTKCPVCGEVLYRRDLAANLDVCTKCGHHFRMSAYDRISMLIDGDFTEIGASIAARRSAGMGRQEDLSGQTRGRQREERAHRRRRLRRRLDRRVRRSRSA